MNPIKRHLDLMKRAVRERRLLTVSHLDEPAVSRCVPFDYEPGGDDGLKGRYVFYLMEPSGTLGPRLEVTSDRLLALRVLDQQFDPAEFVGWPRDWFIERDWPVIRTGRLVNAPGF